MYKKQIAVVVIVLAIMGYLYSLPVKGLIKPKTDAAKNAGMMASTGRPAANVTVDMVSTPAKTAIGSALSAKIIELEGNLKNASGDAEKLTLEKQLAKHWDDVNQPGPAAFYYQLVAAKQNTFADWLMAGNRFNEAVKVTRDTLTQPAMVLKAAESFQNALKLNPTSLDAKMGLGVADVNGAASPMQGIALLLEVVKQEPGNVTANLNLGLFSMKSGQFDKAVNRFKTIIAQKPTDVESYFYLAESYKQLGMKKEAIDAYQHCRKLIADPTIDQKIDDYIKELKN